MSSHLKKNIVVSAINITDAGPFAILKECLNYLSLHATGKYNVIALVHKKELFDFKNIQYYEFPDSKKSWFKRLFYEYFYFLGLSKKLRPHLWLSLHDVTPNVEADIRAVYCHHASPFYKLSFWELKTDPVFVLFHFVYKYLYLINIKKNDIVIVQQSWLRKVFKSKFKLSNIVVAHPNIEYGVVVQRPSSKSDNVIRFFYPSLPRVFKNFETVCESAKILAGKGANNFKLCVTMDGTENRYSRYVFNRYKDVKAIEFIGVQPREKIFELYGESDCMIFASKLESWGVPITEFKNFNKPVILPDLEYARETIGDYAKVKFFNPGNPAQLSKLMNDMIKKTLVFERVNLKEINPPFASNWDQLFDLLLSGEGRRYGC